ncbi:hypothetical protein IQ22_03259 [Pseudomonas duriflava]|uniref:Uncharacterized protein n=1 Tax=Pseudomonas duriflava TaxID=459528 RepID=A0A562Q6X7_9PSED|nr:hypothetical protein [Pseudomonas duriflava]TWI52489.1 hypothetical protein IQ22_03259 [Pseudomonas duriflava]
MPEKVVSSANGYYLFECSSDNSPDAPPYYEARMGTKSVKRFDDRSEAEKFIQYAYARDEDNYTR